MGTWQIVGTSWRILLANLWAVGIIAGVYIVVGLIAPQFARQEPLATLRILVGMVAQFFVMPWIQGGCLSLANAALTQQAGSLLGSFLDGAKRLYARLLGFAALSIAMFLGMMILGVAPFAVSNSFSGEALGVSIALTVLVLIALGIGLYLVMLIAAMAPVAIAVERLGVFGAIRKGLSVGRSALGKLILVTLALALTLAPLALAMLILSFLMTQPGREGAIGSQIIGVILQSLLGSLAMVAFSAAYVQVYRHRTGLASS